MFHLLSNFFGVNDLVNTSLFGTINSGTYLGLISAPLFAIPGSLMTMAIHFKEKGLEQKQKDL